MKKVLVYSSYFLLLLAGYILFGLGSMAMPDKAVEHHVRQTVGQNDLKADFWFAFLYKPNYYMDNFTDALVLNQAWCLGEEESMNLWQRLMLVPRHRCMADGVEQGCESLRRLTEGDTTLKIMCYPRYWHGSTYLMRYLLAIDDYVVLRGLFFLLSSMLLLWVLLALAKRVGVWASALYFLAFVLVDCFMMQFSIQFLPVLLITLGGTLWVLNRKRSSLGVVFFVLGSLTAYFDLLTAPLLTWGLPLLVFIAARHTPQSLRDSSPNLGEQLRYTFASDRGRHSSPKLGEVPEGGRSVPVVAVLASLLWGVGYAATWAAKWLLATLTTPMNVFSDASAQASLRAAVEDYTRWGAVERNLDLVPWLYVTIAAVVLALLAVRHFNGKGWRQALVCLVVAVAPVAWYIVLGNHSYEHYWFTYRSLAVTVMGLLAAVASLVDWRKLKIEN